jgi:uncharacterized protein YndB with AHSA1/START domain
VRLDVVVEELLPHPVEAVWSALTDSDAISDWLMATTDFRPEIGAHFRMKTGHLSPNGWIEAQVLALEPPRRMSWLWATAGDQAPTTVTFELAPEAEGTRLRLTHAGDIDPTIGRLLQEGWPGRVGLLRRSLD